MRLRPTAPGPEVWLGGILLMGATTYWLFQNNSRWVADWVGERPWPSLLGGAVVLLGFRWARSRAIASSPAFARAVRLAERSRRWCRFCSAPLEPQPLTCGSCGRVVDWPSILGAGVGCFAMVVFIGFNLWRHAH
jgi:hypothetical protein